MHCGLGEVNVKSTAPTCSLSRKSCCSSSSQKDTGLSSRRRHTASQLWLLDSLDSSSHTASRIPASPFMLFTYTSSVLTPVLMSSLHLEAEFYLCQGGEALSVCCAASGCWNEKDEGMRRKSARLGLPWPITGCSVPLTC